MARFGGIPASFKGTDKPLNYVLKFKNPDPMNTFSFTFGASGVDPINPNITGVGFLGVSGQHGKLYDNEGNYFHSYSHKQGLEIEGNIFPDYHNYSVNGTLINSNCDRQEGQVNTFFYSGINLSNFECTINENYDPL
jgi:hypothetical protein